LSEKWKYRFSFYEQYGAPGFQRFTPEQQAAINALSFGDRVKIIANVWAFFFGIFYLAVLGLWRQVVLVFGIIVVYGVVFLFLPENVLFSFIDRIVGLVMAAYIAGRTNIWYYQKKTQGQIGWTL
jgi:ABC-type multidrug transport system fused ATPase/permease subunit